MIQFDEKTQYVIEVDGELVVKELELVDEPVAEQPSGEFEPYVKEPTLEEKIAAQGDAIQEIILAIMGG